MEYKKITKKKLKEIIKSHKLWLKGNPEGIQADLSGVNLSYMDLTNVDLRKANLRNAYLMDACLRKANLSDADLSYAILVCADLRNAKMNRTNLSSANLDNAILNSAYLNSSNLSHANLSFTDLTDASLEHSTLCYTNLSGAIGDLIELRKGKVLTKPLTGYKKCRDGVIVTLEIPKGAIVFSINGYKCRTNKVKVMAVEGADKGISSFDSHMQYRVGDEITVDDFNCEYNLECASGIHFFTNREDAELYVML